MYSNNLASVPMYAIGWTMYIMCKSDLLKTRHDNLLWGLVAPLSIRLMQFVLAPGPDGLVVMLDSTARGNRLPTNP